MIQTTSDWRNRPIVGWRDDGSPIIAESVLAEVEFVAAQPGWAAIEYARADHDEAEWWFDVFVVVAWKVERAHWWNDSKRQWRADLSVEPVYANGDTLSHNDVVIVSPDGKVFGFGVQHPSVDAWGARQRELFDRDLARFLARKNEKSCAQAPG